MSAMRDFEDYCWRDVVTPEMLEIYAPYRRERAMPRRAALLILHPVDDIELAVQPVWSVAANRLLTKARALSMPVLHSVPLEGRLALGLERRDGELIVQRPCDGAFLFSELPAALRRLDAAGFILSGATTSGAVRATAVEAKSYAYKVAVAEEATADEAVFLHTMALFDIAHKYADVMSLDEMLEMMGRSLGVSPPA